MANRTDTDDLFAEATFNLTERDIGNVQWGSNSICIVNGPHILCIQNKTNKEKFLRLVFIS